ncbi:hypothetical protein BOTNAR_0199g00150 [Botryotinia narcissicola]|uniref:Uncharacterized protein n=1 Tax=Botryotinia narcissicola TaxID=278944 RepID=A0A4Z1IA19_9HELO|nr:hypothetical protein BOTNAR_0199g00150 [Botryotinia narcissicola]
MVIIIEIKTLTNDTVLLNLKHSPSQSHPKPNSINPLTPYDTEYGIASTNQALMRAFSCVNDHIAPLSYTHRKYFSKVTYDKAQVHTDDSQTVVIENEFDMTVEVTIHIKNSI